MRIINLPLEPIDKRYTQQFYHWFREVFSKEKSIEVLGEKIQSKLENKFFLDPKQTFIWKSSQMLNLWRKINFQKDDIVFVPDMEYPGIEQLIYYKYFKDKKFKIAGYWHAATYDPYDFTRLRGMEFFGKHFEKGWFAMSDLIFVATKFHKRMIVKTRKVPSNKIKVVGFPIDWNGMKRYLVSKKDDTILFTGRKVPEKGYDIVKKISRKYNIISTLDLDLKKQDYYKLLGKSKAVFAPSRQETFGIGVVEGLTLNCVPIVPNKLSFKEIVPKKYRYNRETQIPYMIDKALESKDRFRHLTKKYEYHKVIGSMISLMKKVVEK